MSTFPDDLYDCLAATLFRDKARMHLEISHFSHGLRLYSSETRVKDRHKNVLDVVRVRQTCKAMLAAVRKLEAEELRAALHLFWLSAHSGPCESFVFPSTSDVRPLPWIMESSVQTMKYEGRDELKLYTKRSKRMMKLVLVTRFNTSYDDTLKKHIFPKIIFRLGVAPGVGDGESGSDSDDYMPHKEVWTKEGELAEKVTAWLQEQRATYETNEAAGVVAKF
jgi:hypothetical protein